MAEQRSFIFAIGFLLIFSAVYTTMPVALFGQAGTAETLLPIDPTLITDFAESLNWTKSSYDQVGNTIHYYTLGGWDWLSVTDGTSFAVSRKVKLLGMFWLGALKNTNFFLENGTNLGQSVSMADIADAADNGALRFNLKYVDDGSDAGGFIFWWNTTTYATPALAWASNDLQLLHGLGIGSSAPANVLSLLVSLLLFQLPDMPLLIGVLIGSTLWANIVFILWYVIKESMPFV